MKKHHLGVILAIGLVLGAALFIYLRTDDGFAWAEFQRELSGVRPGWLFGAVFLILVSYAIRAARWAVMLRPLAKVPVSLGRLFSATCIGFTAVVLFGRAGEPVRPFLIARQEGVAFSTQLAAWLVERILDLLMILIIFGLALTQVKNSEMQPGPRVAMAVEAGGWLVGVVGLICLAAIVALKVFQGRVRERVTDGLGFLPDALRLRIAGFLSHFDAGMASTRQGSTVSKLLGYSMVEWAVIAGAFYCVFAGFPVLDNLGMTDVLIVLGFVAFGGVLQIPGIGGGMQLTTVLVLTELYGVQVEAASGVALILWAVNFLVILPVGLLLAFHAGIRWRSMKHIAEEAAGTPS